METSRRFAFLYRRFWFFTLIEWLVFFSIVAILVALLLPSVQWASSGSIEIPVRVEVMNAISGQPIADARVAIVYAPPLVSDNTSSKLRKRLEDDFYNCVPVDSRGLTGDDGIVVIEHEFPTGASHKRPSPHAYMRGTWVMVSAKGYGGVVVPVRYDSQPTKALKEQNWLPVTIGLLPDRMKAE